MIRANRSRLKNPNGLILGTPGSGKSFSVKRENLDCFLTTIDDIIICDPEGEYFPLVQALHGQLIRIASNSEHHINPMDITIDSYLFENTMEVIANKSDFIISLCEIIVGGRYGLSSEERSVIDKCVQRLYKQFIENEPTADKMPLLSDLQRELENEGEVALRVYNSLKMFVNGSQNLFNHHTNIDMSNRIICFDIKELSNQLKKVGMLIVQDTVWNRVSENRNLKKITRYYIDEFHLLLKEEQTAKYRLKKAENVIFKEEKFKPEKRKVLRKLIDNKEEFQLNKSKFRNNDKTNLDRAFYIRRKQKYKQDKRKLNFELKQLKSEKKFRNLTLTNQKKIAKNSNPGLLITKPVKYTGNRMKASAWQKAVNEDQDNDVLHAIDSTKRRIVAPAVQKVSKPQRLQNQQKKRDKISDKDSKSKEKLRKKDNRLKEKHDKPKKKKKAQNKKRHKSSFGERFKDGLKAFLRFVKNVYTAEVKKFFLILIAVILLILLLVALVVMMFSGVSSSSGFILGTYAAQDYDLSEAEKYYTKLAWDMNQNVKLVGDSSTWKTGLSNLGINTSGMKDTPDTFQWGNSTVYNWTPDYDFDTYKLWCFLCAYYYDFDAADNGDIKYWKYTNSTEPLIKEIFDAEYEFVCNYDNTSHWEYRYHFDARGYYSIEDSGTTGSYGYIDIASPSALPMGAVTDGKRLFFDLSNGEVLNYNDGYSATGWYLKNQYVDDYDNSGTCFGKWYTNGETCGYGI